MTLKCLILHQNSLILPQNSSFGTLSHSQDRIKTSATVNSQPIMVKSLAAATKHPISQILSWEMTETAQSPYHKPSNRNVKSLDENQHSEVRARKSQFLRIKGITAIEILNVTVRVMLEEG